MDRQQQGPVNLPVKPVNVQHNRIMHSVSDGWPTQPNQPRAHPFIPAVIPQEPSHFNRILIVIKNHDLIRSNGAPLDLRPKNKTKSIWQIDAIKYGNN